MEIVFLEVKYQMLVYMVSCGFLVSSEAYVSVSV